MPKCILKHATLINAYIKKPCMQVVASALASLVWPDRFFPLAFLGEEKHYAKFTSSLHAWRG